MRQGRKKTKLFIVQCSLFCVFLFGVACAQDSVKVSALKQEILQAKDKSELYSTFEEAADLYFEVNKYNEFVGFLETLAKEKKDLEPITDYFTALSRYYQLKYFEEAQSWDEYFSNSNAYREQIIVSAQKAINASPAVDNLNLYSRMVLFKLHKDQQDAFSEEALTSLMNAASEYAQDATDIMPLKAVADELASYGEKTKAAQLYKVFVNKLLSSGVEDEDLLSAASDFYKEGSLELAESLYDAYLERVVKTFSKEKFAAFLIDIAKQFSYEDGAQRDPPYAEKTFKKIEEVAGKDALSQELNYLRAINLEKAKAYGEAKDVYLSLLNRFPSGAHTDEAKYKLGLIYTYILSDLQNGRSSFEELAGGSTLSTQIISSLYQLGLLSQWEGDNAKAKEYYNLLLERAKGGFSDTLAAARERLKEISDSKSLEYNLKTFLDASLKEEKAMSDMAKVDLRSSAYKIKPESAVEIKSTSYTAESGCMQVELQYLWSGDLGASGPVNNDQSSFPTQYSDSGTKVINLVVVSPSGIIDRSLDILDVQ
jgi:hypothetical protein